MNAVFSQAAILAQHRIPLETAVTAACPGLSNLVLRLYKAALAYGLGPDATCDDQDFIRDRQTSVSDELTMQTVNATVTDVKTGYYIQMRGEISKATATNPTIVWRRGPFMSFGKKIVQESKSPQLNNTAVKLWT